MAIGIAACGRYLPAGGRGAPDEDALTMAVAAASRIAQPVGCLALASTCLPYRRRVQAGLLAEALGLGPDLFVTEHTTSGRAGTEALISQWGLLRGGGGGEGGGPWSGGAVGPWSGGAAGPRSGGAAGPRPGGAPGLTVAAEPAGAAALLLAEGGAIATIDGFASTCSEDPGLQFTLAGEAQMRDLDVPDYTAALYAAAVGRASRAVMARLETRPEQYRFLVLNPPSARLAGAGARAAGHGSPPIVADPLLGLAAALDAARPGDRILVVAYGSGSACDAVSLTVGVGRAVF